MKPYFLLLITVLFLTSSMIPANETTASKKIMEISIGNTCEPWQDDESGRDVKEYPFSALGIPKGHLPPPGECKIWVPGRPAGQQGTPQSCQSAMRNAPLGAWVITHTGKRYKVNVLSRNKPMVIIEVRFYALP